MSDDDLNDLDPNDLDSIVRWCRQQRLRNRSEEPNPVPKQQQRDSTDAQVSRQWQEWIHKKCMTMIEDAITIVVEEAADLTREAIDRLRDEMRSEIKEKIALKPKVIVYDPSEAMKKQIETFAGGLREELREIKQELGLSRKSVVDLPMLPRKRA